jgi:hypothetical protein
VGSSFLTKGKHRCLLESKYVRVRTHD